MRKISVAVLCLLVICLLNTPNRIIAQSSGISLNDLSSFKNPGKSWSIAGDVTADLNKPNAILASPGTGVLVNTSVNNNGIDLVTNLEHGDADLELDYMLAKGSNSGIYLQGRYEFQLLDSWGMKNPRPGDNGGIYERWDESKPEGQKGYGGHAPRQNVSRGPGLWQHLRLSFQAPRFDATGRKFENARILRAELNGVVIHENLELQGPTRGSISNAEAATGPLRLQGDHGSAAFKNIRVTSYGMPRPELSNLKYTVYKGRFNPTADISKLPPEAQGPLGNLSGDNINKLPGEYFIKYTGTIKIPQAGEYFFNTAVPGGRGIIRINNQPLNAQPGRGQRAGVTLSAGELPFELLYVKNQDWTNRAVAMSVAGPGVRDYIIGDALAAAGEGGADPIYVDAPVNTVLRSFMDMPGGPRVVHAVSVGSPEQVHYTYDMDKGAIIQVWRGRFLDATPMWYSRGDGSSRPVGTVQRFGRPAFALGKLASAESPWETDSAGYVTKGYRLDKNDLPVFRYQTFGSTVEDAINVTENGQGIRREINIQQPVPNLYARLAESNSIQMLENGLYILEGKSYYVKVEDSGGAKPVIRDSNGRKELVVPVQNKIIYSILF